MCVCAGVSVRAPGRGGSLGQRSPLQIDCLRDGVQEIGIGHYSCAGIGYWAIRNTLAEYDGGDGGVEKKQPASFAHLASALKGGVGSEDAGEGRGRGRETETECHSSGWRGWKGID